VMPGNPKSPYANARVPHARWQKDGRPLDRYGRFLSTAHCEAAHIPLQEFRFLPHIFAMKPRVH
jgi:hypothetical protein